MAKELPARVSPVLILVLLLGVSFLHAESPPARVSYVEGTVAVAQEGDLDWLEVTVNTPVRPADRFILQSDGLLEIENGPGTFVRVGPGSDITIVALDPDNSSLALAEGDLIIRSKGSEKFLVTVGTAKVELLERGLYRLQRNGGTIKLVARRGQARVTVADNTRTISSGEVIEYVDAVNRFTRVSLIDIRDNFDYWSDRRDAGTVSTQSARLIGSDYTASYELDRHGTWNYDGDYGWVWWPAVNVGWSPYVSGRWIFYPGWGWTWVSFESWGWLPYHYGRWAYVDHHSRWCWIPGHFDRWGPALVDFRHSNGFIGWSPLPPLRQTDARLRFESRLRAAEQPGLRFVPEQEFFASSRLRQRRGEVIRSVPLPGNGTVVGRDVFGRVGESPSAVLSRQGGVVIGRGLRGGLSSEQASSPGAAQGRGPRVITIPAVSPPPSAAYPDRGQIDRDPYGSRPGFGQRGITGSSPASAFGSRSWYGNRPAYGSSAPNVGGASAPGSPSSPGVRSGSPFRREGPSRAFERPSVPSIPRSTPSAPGSSTPSRSGPSRLGPGLRGNR